MTDEEKDEKEPLFDWSQLAEAVGNLTSVGLGAAIAGTPGAIAGAVTSPYAIRIFGKAAEEFSHRVLGHREKKRVGAVITYAALKIQQNKDTGKDLRDDDFFEEQLDERSAADEIAEGVLLAAQRTHQEKKLRYLGNLLGNIPFHAEIDRSFANALINQAERMTYHQYGILSIAVRAERLLAPQTLDRLRANVDIYGARAEVLQSEIRELTERQIVDIGQSNGPRGIYDTFDVKVFGKYLAELMDLQEIELEELRTLGVLTVFP
jgi:hypothetical protein